VTQRLGSSSLRPGPPGDSSRNAAVTPPTRVRRPEHRPVALLHRELHRHPLAGPVRTAPVVPEARTGGLRSRSSSATRDRRSSLMTRTAGTDRRHQRSPGAREAGLGVAPLDQQPLSTGKPSLERVSLPVRRSGSLAMREQDSMDLGQHRADRAPLAAMVGGSGRRSRCSGRS
jgi:hypothetical protein